MVKNHLHIHTLFRYQLTCNVHIYSQRCPELPLQLIMLYILTHSSLHHSELLLLCWRFWLLLIYIKFRAKKMYSDKIELQYSSGNLREAWQGIKSMASFNQNKFSTGKHVNLEGVTDQDLPNILNSFYSRFEQPDFSEKISQIKHSFSPVNEIIFQKTRWLNFWKALMWEKLRVLMAYVAIYCITALYSLVVFSNIFFKW